MKFKGMTAILLALVFQLVQLPLTLAVQTECRDSSTLHCGCCAEIPSCPCATDRGKSPERAPLPVLPQTVKLPAAKPCETRVSLEETPASETACRIHALPAAEPLTGYAGVSLAVAFCSYLM